MNQLNCLPCLFSFDKRVSEQEIKVQLTDRGAFKDLKIHDETRREEQKQNPCEQGGLSMVATCVRRGKIACMHSYPENLTGLRPKREGLDCATGPCFLSEFCHAV